MLLLKILGLGLITAIAGSSTDPKTPPVKAGTFSERLNQLIKSDISPCDNFYEFLCGNVIQNHKTVTPNKRALFAHFLNRKSSETLSETGVKLKSFYKSCRKHQSIEKLKSSSLYHEAGGFPAIMNTPATSLPDWTKIIPVFQKYGINLFFKLKISLQNNKRHFTIEPNFKFKYTMEVFQTKTTKLLIKLNVPREKAVQISKEIWNLEKTRREIIKTREKDPKLYKKEFSYEAFSAKYQNINWDAYFMEFLGKVPKPTDDVHLNHIDNLENIFALLITTPKKDVSNYCWMVFSQETNRGNCMNLSKKYFLPLYDYITETPEYKKSSFLKLVNELKSVYDQDVSLSVWVDEISLSNSNSYSNKFKHLYANEDGVIDKEYSKLQINETNFFSNLQNCEVVHQIPTLPSNETNLVKSLLQNLNPIPSDILSSDLYFLYQYGDIATEISKNMIQGGNKNISWRSTESNKKFENFTLCFQNGTQSEGLKPFFEKMIVENLAQDQSYKALRNWINGTKKLKMEELISDEWSADKIFFTTVAMNKCLHGKDYLDNISKVSKDFNSIFQCPVIQFCEIN